MAVIEIQGVLCMPAFMDGKSLSELIVKLEPSLFWKYVWHNKNRNLFYMHSSGRQIWYFTSSII